MLSRVHEIGIFGMSLRGLRSVVGVVKRCHINIAHRYTDLSRPGHAQTRTSMARRPSTVPSGASSVKITWTGRRLRPPTHELKQWNSSSDVTQSAPAIYIQQHTHTHTHTCNKSMLRKTVLLFNQHNINTLAANYNASRIVSID